MMIHFHGSPLSGPKESCVRFYRGRHAMVSFAAPDQLPAIADVCQSFALDNGAFSTWRSGAVFDMKGYREFVSEWKRHPGFAWCLIPDVINGIGKDNDEMITDWLTSGVVQRSWSVPVWHFHESRDRLRALAGRFDMVALGSSGQCLPAILDEQGRPHCKLHGLRMLNPEIFTRVPFASADSTNAAQNAGSIARFGTYPPPDPWQRATTIADRIEAFNSPAVFIRRDVQLNLWET